MEFPKLELKQTIKIGEGCLWNAAWSPTGDRLAVCGQDREVVILSLLPGMDEVRVEERLGGVHRKTIRSVAFDASGLRLAAASFDGRVSIYLHRRLTSGLPEAGLPGVGVEWVQAACLEGHENEVKGVAWSPSASLLATCGRDKTVWIWSSPPDDGAPDEFECVAVLAEHAQDVKAVRWLPVITAAGEILVSCSYDDTVRLWQCDPVHDEWFPSGQLSGHIDTVWACDFDPQGGRWMVTVSADHCLVLWRRADRGGTVLFEPYSRTWHAHRAPIYSVAWLSGSAGAESIVATCSADGSMALWRASLPQALEDEETEGEAVQFAEIQRLEDVHSAGEINCVAWHPKQSLLVSVGDDGLLKLWKFA